jgi:hypothetical protein
MSIFSTTLSVRKGSEHTLRRDDRSKLQLLQQIGLRASRQNQKSLREAYAGMKCLPFVEKYGDQL